MPRRRVSAVAGCVGVTPRCDAPVQMCRSCVNDHAKVGEDCYKCWPPAVNWIISIIIVLFARTSSAAALWHLPL